MRNLSHTGHALALGVALCLLPNVRSALADDGTRIAQLEAPKRHFKVRKPAALSGAAALTVYDQIIDDMVKRYAISGMPEASEFREWRRYNQYPFRSATHGERYINHYGNVGSAAYGKYEESGPMPPGAILAKDSFTVTTRGDVYPGPLFLMEKMPAGFDPPNSDWKYSMIMPDGSIFGISKDVNAKRVDFCAECHNAVGDSQDHMFYPPEENRLKTLIIKPSGG